jgi:hypothetical protein
MRILVLFAISVFLWGCAQIKIVEGGPKDTTPPTVLSSTLQDSTLNWNGSGFELLMDEYVGVNDVANQVTISPPLKFPLNIVTKGKKVLVSWNDTLAKNTTYQINFGNAIVDITESNPISLTKIWSTGSVLDSLTVSGVVRSAWTQKPLPNAVVQLLSDPFSIEGNIIPRYQVKSDKEGKFVFQCLPSANFYLLAFDDTNKSGRWEEGEWLDATREWLDTRQQAADLKLSLSLNTPAKAFLGEVYTDSSGWASWAWDHRLPLPQLSTSDSAWEWLPYSDSLVIRWKGEIDNQFHPVNFSLPDGKQDSIAVPVFAERWKFNPRFGKKKEWKVMQGKTFSIPMPVQTSGVDSKRWIWKKEKETQAAEVRLESGSAILSTQTLSPGNYTLQLMPKGIYYQDNLWVVDTVSFKVQILGKEEVGDIGVKSDWSNQFLWMLEDEQGNLQTIDPVVLKVKGITLVPGTYTLRVIEENRNTGTWDGIDWQHDWPAEQVHVFPSPIVVRANWSQQLEWK